MFAFEKLEVYQRAWEANLQVYRFLKSAEHVPQYVKDQLGRASFSIMLNIAEGSGKFANKDRRNFYVIARASIFECYSLVYFLHSEGDLPINLHENLRLLYESISKMLFQLIRNLEQ